MSDKRHGDGELASGEKSQRISLWRRGLLLYVFVILAAGWSYGLWQIRVDRELTLESSRNQLTMTASALAVHVTAMINDGVGAAAAAANEVIARGTARPSQQEVSGILARMLTGGDYVNMLFIATPTRYAAARRAGSPLNDDRPEWLGEMFADAQQTTWIGSPLNTAKGDARVLIPIARRMPDIAGEPAWAGALFSVNSLDDLYRSLPVDHSNVSLVTTSGLLLVRIPTDDSAHYAGMNLANYPAYRQYMRRQAPLAVMDAPNPLSGVPRQFAVRQIDRYPFAAVSGRDVEDALIPWRARTRNSVLLLSIASLVLVALTTSLAMLLKRRFDALRRSEQRFDLAVTGTHDGIWDWEVATGSVYHSPRFKELLGVRSGDEFPPVLETFWERMHPDDAPATELALQRHLLHDDPYDVEFRLRMRSGEYRWFRGRGQALRNNRGEALRMAGSISDIHDRKCAEQALEQARLAELHAREEFAQHLLLAQEQERQRLANELHDSVAQNLSLIKNRALLVLQQPGLSTTATHHAQMLSDVASEVIAEVRRVSHNLRPLHIELLGLSNALETLIERVSETHALPIEKRIENVDDIFTDTNATHVYRIVQEALNNVLKHAQARHCRVLLERDLHCARLIISDDGVGFDPQMAHKAHGLGLASMAERARMLNARLDVKSGHDNVRGTVISVEIPTQDVGAGQISA